MDTELGSPRSRQTMFWKLSQAAAFRKVKLVKAVTAALHCLGDRQEITRYLFQILYYLRDTLLSLKIFVYLKEIIYY